MKATLNAFWTYGHARPPRNDVELNLGRLSEHQRQRVFAEFGPDPDMQLYERGYRRRRATAADGRRRLDGKGLI